MYEWPRDALYLELMPEMRRTVGPPPPGADQLRPYFRSETAHLFPPLWLARIPAATVGRGLLIAPDGVILSTGGRPLPARRARTKPPNRLNGTYLSMAGLWSTGYAHWILDYLPMLLLYEEIDDGSIPILLDRTPERWQRESLTAAGVDHSRLVAIGDRFVQVESLYVGSPLGSPAQCHPRAADWLRQTFLPEPVSHPDRRIYISRNAARRRQISNEEQLLPVLATYGIEVIRTEDLSFGEQVTLFASAKLIIAPSGAALANLVFAPSHATVIDLAPVEHRYVGYWSLATLVGLDYRVLESRLVGRGPRDLLNMHVDPQSLSSVLSQVGA